MPRTLAVTRVEVAVVGGGLVGLGVARDLALRGVETGLFEAGGLCAGASGRNHGLLHSGARYAVGDPGAAAECASENVLLRRLAAPYVVPCGGLVVATSAQEEEYLDRLGAAMSELGIPSAEARRDAVWLPHWCRAVSTNDAAIDPFGVALACAAQAMECGAEMHLERVVDFADGRVSTAGGEEHHADAVVLACGWEDGLLRRILPGAPALSPDRGTMVVTERRLHPQVVGRARPPADGDLVVPSGHASIVGTTSSPGTDIQPTPQDVDRLLDEAAALFPQVREARLLRAYTGVRPLLGDAGGRLASRGHRILVGDGVVAALGGKLTTFRLMAQEAADAACEMLGHNGRGTTDRKPLPDLTGQRQSGEAGCGCEGGGLRLPEPLLPLLGPAPHRFGGTGFGPCQGLRCLALSPDPRTAARERWRGLRAVIYRGQLAQGYLLWARERSARGR